MKKLCLLLLLGWGSGRGLAQDVFSRVFLEDSLLTMMQAKQLLSEAEVSKNERTLGYAYHYLGRAHGKLNQRSQSLKNYYQSLHYAEQSTDSALLYMVKFRIATAYVTESSLLKDAALLFEQTLPYYKRNRNNRLIVMHLINLAKIEFEQQHYEEGKPFLEQARIFNQQAQHPLADVLYFNLLGRYFLETNRYSGALPVLQKAIEVSRFYKNRGMEYVNLHYMGVCHEQMGQYAKSVDIFEDLIAFTSQHRESSIRRDSHFHLIHCYQQLGNIPKALYHAQRHLKMADSLRRLNTVESINFIKTANEKEQIETVLRQTETEKKLAETESRVNRQRMYAAIALGVLILLVGAFGIIFFRQKLQIKQHEVEANQLKIKEIESERELTMMKALLEGQDSERERVAQDLHDSLGGMLAQIKFRTSNYFAKLDKSEASAETRNIEKLIDETCTELRSISSNLQPNTLKRFGLITALNDYVQKLSTKQGTHLTFEHSGSDQNLPDDQQLMIFRTAQEGINNALKHAQATDIFVQLHISEDHLVLEVEDNGRGFESHQNTQGMGLKNIEMRANYLKANLNIKSAPTEGTSLLLDMRLA